MADRWAVTYRMSGPSELRCDDLVIATGGEQKHPILVTIAQAMNHWDRRHGPEGAMEAAEDTDVDRWVPFHQSAGGMWLVRNSKTGQIAPDGDDVASFFSDEGAGFYALGLNTAEKRPDAQ